MEHSDHAEDVISAIDSCFADLERCTDPTIEQEAVWAEIKSWVDNGEITYEEGEQRFYDYFTKGTTPPF